MPTDYPKTVSHAWQQPETSRVGGLFEREAAKHPGKSGFQVIPDNRRAFTDRVALAEFAEKTLDVQYYMWNNDTIGKTLAERVIASADRGVRVRFLVDDINLKRRDSLAAAMSAHPKIEVRLFNPALHREWKMLEAGLSFKRMNKRMHNKVMIMDNACAIIGGRNIGDEYFGVHPEFNMRDLDIVAVGPIVRDISHSFDEFWNSVAAIPIEVLVDEPSDMEDFKRSLALLKKQVAQADYPFSLDRDLKSLEANLSGISRNLIWARGEVFHDSFRSMKEAGRGETVLEQLHREVSSAQREIFVESAYFVMRDPGVETAGSLEKRGVRIRVLTNSLASNDVIAAQAGYRKHSQALLACGVELYELRPDAAVVKADVMGDRKHARTSLHTKALVIDGNRAFVGSYNLDPRSAEINSEIGLMVYSPVFAGKVRDYLNQGVKPENAYRVSLTKRGRQQWQTQVDGRVHTWSREPETNAWTRWKSKMFGWLPIESQL
ncbi:phospholipase D family protein [Verrucomicrobiaceae bacterium N1E253]|uniref:Phospholipase D family protein n=1 Tax=Oceaniferula marina TaxID=2748318 RepID=A0A851GCM8_9BACT|nr:phospholipase D family protein [Oceaniferula marina]